MVKLQHGNFYALRTVQTKFRSKGSDVDHWQDETISCPTNAKARHVASAWEKNPCAGQVLVMVGLRPDA